MIVCYSGCGEDGIDDGVECRNDSRYLSFHEHAVSMHDKIMTKGHGQATLESTKFWS